MSFNEISRDQSRPDLATIFVPERAKQYFNKSKGVQIKTIQDYTRLYEIVRDHTKLSLVWVPWGLVFVTLMSLGSW